MEELLKRLKELRISIRLKEGQLDLKAPKGVMNQELLTEIRAQKQSIIQYLSENDFGAAAQNTIAVVPASSNGYKLSSSQYQMWVIDQFDHIEAAYNMHSAFEINGDIDTSVLQKAFNALLQRHEILRTVFKKNSLGDVKQFVLSDEAYNFTIETVDLSNVDTFDAALKTTLLADMNYNFNLETELLLKVKLIQKDATTTILSITIHHIISDGWSTEIMVKELFQLYQSIKNNTAPELAPLAIQYKDYAHWQREQLSGKAMAKSLRYWQSQFDDQIPVLNLQTNGLVRPVIRTFKGSSTKVRFNDDLITKFKKQCESHGATLFMGLLAVVKTLLFKYTNEKDIVIGTPVAGRNQVELQNQLGLFINTLPLRTTFEAEDSFTALLQSIQKNTIESFEHQDFPFDQLVNSLRIRRDSHHPLFDVMVIYQNEEQNQFNETFSLGDITLKEIFPIAVEASKFDLEFSFVKTAHDLGLTITYNTDIHRSDFIETVGTHLENVLTDIVNDPTKSLYDYEILSEEENSFLAKEYNNTTSVEAPNNEPTLLDVFQEQVAKYGDQIAVEDEEKHYSYSELDTLSETIKQRLLAITKGEKMPIGIMMERSALVLPILLGVMKAGCAYIPIDISLPSERIAHIVGHSKVKLVISNVPEVKDVRDLNVIDSADITAPLAATHTMQHVNVSSNDTAYIIYTSGSTGKPKGVAIGHSALHNFLMSIVKKPGITANDRLFAVTTYSFDISILEFFAPLMTGATVYVASKELLVDAGKTIEKLKEYQPTIIQATPSFYQILFEFGWEGSSSLKVLCGGDALTPTLAAQLIASTAALWNMYGPTETTIWSSINKIENPEDASNIGYPIDNTQLYVLSEHKKLRPIHALGTLYIGGKGLAKGYYKEPGLTNDRFITSPFNPAEKIYNTGDVVKRMDNGSIVFMGREDHQVKIRGYRIELGDIEANITRFSEEITQVIVISKEKDDEKMLVAYYTSDAEIDKKELIKFLKTKLPLYMIPNHFVALEYVPLTPNGKVDRKRLPAVKDDDLVKSNYVAPETDMEKIITEIWEEELKIDKIGILDNFFELGGHSLFIVKIMNVINVKLGKDVSFNTFFANQDIKSLALAIEEIEEEITELRIPKTTNKGPYFEVSRSQYRLWVTSQLGGTKAFHIPLVFEVEGNYDPYIYKAVLKSLVDRHDSLRTSFKLDKTNQVQQYIADKDDFAVNFHIHDTIASREEAKHILSTIINEEFDLVNGPLVRAGTVKIGENKYAAFLVIHHLVSDGWSMQVVYQEIIQHFNSILRTGKPFDMPPLEIQYTDYSQYINDRKESIIQKEKDFWNTTFKKPVPYVKLPFEKESRPLKKTYNGDSVGIRLKVENTRLLKKMSSSLGVTDFAILMGVYKILLWKYTSINDFTIGIPISGRINSQLEPQIGLFLNTLPIRTDFLKEHTFAGVMKNEGKSLVQFYDNQLYHIDDLISDLNIKTPQGRSPLFDILMVFQNQTTLNIFNNFNTIASDFKIKMWNDLEFKHAQFDLSLAFTEDKDKENQRISISTSFNTDAFQYEHVSRMLDDYEYLISQVVRNKEMSIKEFFSKTSYKFITDEEIIFKIDEITDEEADATKNNVAITENLELKEQLHGIISNHLDIEISYEDDYFASGGSSLGAIQIVNDLNEALGMKYNIIEFYDNPSVNALHDFMTQKENVETAQDELDSILMTLNHQSDEFSNVVFFPPVLGEGIVYQPIAGKIKGEFNTYAFNIPQLQEDQNTMASLTTTFIKNIEQKVNTNAPLYLVGYSIGVNYAFEVAKQIENLYPEMKLILIDRGAKIADKARITGRLVKRVLSQHMPLIENLGFSESQTEQIKIQIKQSLERLETYTVSGKITAPIYALEAEGNGFSDYMKEWEEHTNSFMGVQQIKGQHLEALTAPNDELIVSLLKQFALDLLPK